MRLFDIGTRDDGPVVVHDRILTVPNVITFLRLLGLPVFVWLVMSRENLVAAFWTIAVVAGTDWIDGYVARRFDQVSRLGKILDPLVDRVLLATVGVTLVLAGIVPLWIVILVLGRDVVLLATAYALFRGIPDIAVTRTGKFASTCLYFGFPAFLLVEHDWAGQGVSAVVAWGFTLVGIVGYYVAGAQYAQAARVLLKERSNGRASR